MISKKQYIPILGSAGLAVAQTSVFSFCGGSDCTISHSGSLVTWNAHATTFTDAAEYSAFEASLAASATDEDDPDSGLEITVNAELPTTVVQTAKNGYTTLTCCDDRYVKTYILLEPDESCSEKENWLSVGDLPTGFGGYNDVFITVLPTDGPKVNDTLLLGENGCSTLLPPPRAAPPRTKTIYARLVPEGGINLGPKTGSDAPTLTNEPLFTDEPVRTDYGESASAIVTSQNGNGESDGGGGGQPTSTANASGTATPPDEISSASSHGVESWAMWLAAGVVLVAAQAVVTV